MSKFEEIHKAGGHVSQHPFESHDLLASAQDFCTRTQHASDVVFGGLIDGAGADLKKQINNPDQLMNEAKTAIISGLTGKAIGLGLRAIPVLGAPIAIAGTGVALYNAANSEAFKTMIPELQRTWGKAFAENDAHNLHLYKDNVSRKYGHTAVEIGIAVGSAAIGFGSGLKTGGLLRTRLAGMSKAPEVLRETSGQSPFKSLDFKKIFSQKPAGSRLEIDEFGTKRIYHPDKSYDFHYTDGSRFSLNTKGIGKMQNYNGETTREIPGVMRITDRSNGDRIYKYHSDGMVETHKKSGTIIREHGNGIVDTQRSNGITYREHPNGTTEIIKQQQAS